MTSKLFPPSIYRFPVTFAALIALAMSGCQMVNPAAFNADMGRNVSNANQAETRAAAQKPTGSPRRRTAQPPAPPSTQQQTPTNPRQSLTHQQADVQTVGWQTPPGEPVMPLPANTQSQQPTPANPANWNEEMSYPPMQQTHDVNRYDTGPGTFRSNTVQTLPQSATEKLIQLSGEMLTMRQEMQMLHQSVQELKADKAQLMEIRQELNIRLNAMEDRLENALENEAMAQSQYDDLSQRVQIFNDRRQKQISELNQIIDQLELQLRQTPTQSSAPPATGNRTSDRRSMGVRNGLR
ncbi:MAG: hypothetical protein P8J91_08940 [Pirellulaceae bacterium]|nr:hypothetical protein [Pirellulaceae bacterium]MDG2103863.1 hypothetical protein [Pirellulaceae bacterium]